MPNDADWISDITFEQQRGVARDEDSRIIRG